MSPRERVRRTRAVLLGAVAARAVLWGAAAGMAAIGVAAVLDLLVDLPHEARRLMAPLAWAAAGVVMVAFIWRGRRTRSLTSTALWIEERMPSLHYALVTALEPGTEDVASLLAREVERTRWESALFPRTPRARRCRRSSLSSSRR